MEKICSNCIQKMSIKNFTPNKNTKDGYKNQCKKCINEKDRLRRVNKNPYYGCVYAYVSSENKYYIGSTRGIRQRKHEHKKAYDNGKNTYFYTRARELGGLGNFVFMILDEWDNINTKELRQKEGEYIIKYKSNNPKYGYNCVIAGRDKEQYKKDTKEHIIQHAKEYNEKNRELINEKMRKIYHRDKKQISCECGATFNKKQTKSHLKTKRHMDYLNSKNDNNYENNKDDTNVKDKKVKCECGAVVNKHGLNRHKKSKKHIDYINTLNRN